MSVYEEAHPCLNALVDAPEYEDPFNPRHAEQVSRAMHMLLTDMCTASGVNTFDDLKPANINKPVVTKKRLCIWVSAFAYMMNRFANPHLQMAVERLDAINNELAAEQKNVIELQSKLIEKRDEELSLVKAAIKEEVKSVQGVVETEMKSYSSALRKTCSAALSPKKIRTAVKQASEKEDRSRNVVIFGLKDSTEGEQNLERDVSEVFAEIDEKPVIRDCCRVGSVRTDSNRPVKITLTSSDMVNHILRKAKSLRTKEGYSHVYISPDRTVEERRAFKKLWKELQEKRKSDTSKVYYIRNNKIVSADRT